VSSGEDFVAVEEPLEVRIHGRPYAVLLRLPGREEDLIAGFLAAEGILREAEDLAGIAACPEAGSGRPATNVWNAVLRAGLSWKAERRTAEGPLAASCGLCGVRSLEDLEPRLPPRAPAPAPGELAAGLGAWLGEMEAQQAVFQRTGGTHAAALLERDQAGEWRWLDLAEDVGRHNAVDKVFGARLRGGRWPLRRPSLLLVSGRISFEIMQKAALAGVPAVAGISAPTSLAVAAARRYGQILLGMARAGRAALYAAP